MAAPDAKFAEAYGLVVALLDLQPLKNRNTSYHTYGPSCKPDWAKKFTNLMNRNGTSSKSGVAPELESIIRSDDNKLCADCLAKGPRWASVNLGYAFFFPFVIRFIQDSNLY